jgi:hypothetical protein
LLSVANPKPAPPPGIPPPTGTAAPPPGTTGDEEAIVDEHPTVIEVMVIHEVPITEVTMIELPTDKSGSTMELVACAWRYRRLFGRLSFC